MRPRSTRLSWSRRWSYVRKEDPMSLLQTGFAMGAALLALCLTI